MSTSPKTVQVVASVEFSHEQQQVLTELLATANNHQKEVLEGLLNAYGSKSDESI